MARKIIILVKYVLILSLCSCTMITNKVQQMDTSNIAIVVPIIDIDF